MRGKIKISMILIAILMMAIIPNSYGALTSKPTTKTDGSNVLVNKTVSASYLLCQQMKSNGESLYGTSVKPHLATNKDWGAVSYLSNSVYGTNTTGQNTGIEKTINGVRYYSTTGNASGVMNWGSNPYKTGGFYTYTSGLMSNYTSGISSVNDLYNNKDSQYVEYINPTLSAQTQGMAISETQSKYSGKYVVSYTSNEPCSIRAGLFGIYFGSVNGPEWDWCKGGGSSLKTFRPVVWN